MSNTEGGQQQEYSVAKGISPRVERYAKGEPLAVVLEFQPHHNHIQNIEKEWGNNEIIILTQPTLVPLVSKPNDGGGIRMKPKRGVA